MTTMPKCVADVCCNHGGSIKVAEEMTQVLAAYCKVDTVKYQKRTVGDMPEEKLSMPYTGPHSFGQTYGEHRSKLEFSIAEHGLLKKMCDIYKVNYCCSAWDLNAVLELVALAPKMIKIPSARNTDMEILEAASAVDWEVHISLGMTTLDEKEKIKRFIESDKPERWVVYMCTAAYPCEFKDVCLGDFDAFKTWLPSGCRAGLSGHHRGIAVDILAYGLGATHIERHFTLDRTAKGTDHAASLEPEGMKRLVRDLQACEAAMGTSGGTVKACEEAARAKLK